MFTIHSLRSCAVTLLLLIQLPFIAPAQVAIKQDASAPHSSAMLDVQSSTKGFLLPRMSQVQRITISNPSNGLLVYDTTSNRLYQYQDGFWRFLINNTYWAASTSRNWVYNTMDSIGIGTAAPTAKLHVSNGDLRVSNADINVVNGDIFMNKPGGILQFQDVGVNTGYLQISGNNLRLGTNAGNTTGNLVMRLNGTDRVTVDASGEVNLASGKITSNATGEASLLPLAWGVTASISTGGISRGTSNVTVTRIAQGQYRIHCTGITSNSCIMLTTVASNVNIAALPQIGFADVYTRSQNTGEGIDQLFRFVIY